MVADCIELELYACTWDDLRPELLTSIFKILGKNVCALPQVMCDENKEVADAERRRVEAEAAKKAPFQGVGFR